MSRLLLVLLVTWSLASVPSLTSAATADPAQDLAGGSPGSTGWVEVDQNGPPDDDDEGDPGDGYGATGGYFFLKATSESDTSGQTDSSLLDEYLLILAMMIQQLAP